MDKIKRLINFIIPVTACNLKCHYCYIGQENKFTGELGTLNYSPEHIAQSLTINRLGGVCHMNMCGLGETLMTPYTVVLAEKMLRNGHYVSIVTNGTITKRIEELCNLPLELRQRLFFKFSFHFLELKRLDLISLFFDNVKLVRDNGCAFSVELTVNDESIGNIGEIQEICLRELGEVCHVIESRNNLDGLSRLSKLPLEKHQKSWGSFNSPLFDFQQTQWMVKRNEFCYAGDWITSLNVGSGWLMPCFAGGNAIQNIFENPEEPIRFASIGNQCQWAHCYAAYVLLTTGAVPSLQTPCYSQMRDRRCENGTNWLTRKVETFFSSKLCETNQEYSDDKKSYIDSLMAMEYGNGNSLYTFSEIGTIIAEHLISHNIHSVSIWGNDKYGRWLFSLLKNTSIDIKYVLDLDYCETVESGKNGKLKQRVKYTIKSIIRRKGKPLLLNRYDRLPYVDAVIIGDYSHFNSIKNHVGNKPYGELLSLTELAD